MVRLRLGVITDPGEQLEELVRLTYLSEEEVEQRVQICRHIQATFRRSGHPAAAVHPFGSSVNSLGFPGCDLDIYLDLGPAAPPGGPALDTEHQRVRAALRLLREMPQCARVQGILQARVPIVKFVHRDTGVACDISFRNRMSVANTQFIRACVDADARVRDLLVSLRYFAKVQGLAGGGGGSRISNYALTLLALTFLQQRRPPLLRTVAELQAAPDLPEDRIDGWNCSFPAASAVLAPPAPASSLRLLAEFFAWAAAINFPSVVVCPLLGRLVARADLQQPELVAATFPAGRAFMGADGLQTEKPMCLQDPFELRHNVCRGLPERAVRGLARYFGAAALLVARMVEGKEQVVGGLNAVFGLALEGEEEEGGLEEVLVVLGEEVRQVFRAPVHLVLPADYMQLFAGREVVEVAAELVTTVLRDCLGLEQREVGGKRSSDEFKEEVAKKIKLNHETKAEVVNGEMPKENIVEGDKEKDDETTSEEVEKSEPKSGCDDARGRYRVVGGEWVVWWTVWAGRRRAGAEVAADLGVVERERRVTEVVVGEGVKLEEPEVAATCHLVAARSATGQVHLWLALAKTYSRKRAFESLVSWFRPFLADVTGRLVRERIAASKLAQ